MLLKTINCFEVIIKVFGIHSVCSFLKFSSHERPSNLFYASQNTLERASEFLVDILVSGWVLIIYPCFRELSINCWSSDLLLLNQSWCLCIISLRTSNDAEYVASGKTFRADFISSLISKCWVHCSAWWRAESPFQQFSKEERWCAWE